MASDASASPAGCSASVPPGKASHGSCLANAATSSGAMAASVASERRSSGRSSSPGGESAGMLPARRSSPSKDLWLGIRSGETGELRGKMDDARATGAASAKAAAMPPPPLKTTGQHTSSASWAPESASLEGLGSSLAASGATPTSTDKADPAPISSSRSERPSARLAARSMAAVGTNRAAGRTHTLSGTGTEASLRSALPSGSVPGAGEGTAEAAAWELAPAAAAA
mmetsp:Transcript_7900/g.31218  ORF Transcript_7900/g.31218 Transcript_7900/m.31218 type:complete len:227 (-) Transcript_7900:6584-7264(-)